MSTFYRRWIAANGVAEAIGLGTTFIIGTFAGPLLGEATDVLALVAGALGAIVLGTLFEGVVVGFAQQRVLARELVDLSPRAWVVATALGAGLAWLVGMVPSTMMALNDAASADAQPREPGALLKYMLAAALGLVTGPILGCAQAFVLRHLVRRPSRWLWANALAWAVGMPLIFLGMDYVPWTGHPVAKLVSIYGVCGVSGLVVGAIHGRVLVRLLRETTMSGN